MYDEAVLITARRGTIRQHPAGGGQDRYVAALTDPTNDLIGLREDLDYAEHLARRYPASLFGDSESDDERGRIDLAQQFTLECLNAGIPERFLRAAELAAVGHFSAELAPLLEEIHREPGDEPDSVQSLLELATWALDQVLRQRRIRISDCGFCGIPWISLTDIDDYCERPAPGRAMPCRYIKKEERFLDRNLEWRREYLKVYDRKRRGIITDAEWKHWKSGNGPDLWIPFDEWKAAGG